MLGADLVVLGALGCAGRAGLGWAWGLALVGALGWVWCGFGCGGRAAGRVSSCLHDCLCSCVSKMCIMGLEQNMDRPSQKEPKARLL